MSTPLTWTSPTTYSSGLLRSGVSGAITLDASLGMFMAVRRLLEREIYMPHQDKALSRISHIQVVNRFLIKNERTLDRHQMCRNRQFLVHSSLTSNVCRRKGLV